MNPAQDMWSNPVEGEIIDTSIIKILGLFLFSLLALPVGVWIIWAWWTGGVWLNHSFTLGGAFVGAVLVLAGVVGIPGCILVLFNRPRLILAKDYLQEGTRRGGVRLQIPYRNIARMELVREENETFIGLDLRDTEDPDTLVKDAAVGKKWSGWHHKLNGMWKMPLEQIHDRMQARVADNS